MYIFFFKIIFLFNELVLVEDEVDIESFIYGLSEE